MRHKEPMTRRFLMHELAVKDGKVSNWAKKVQEDAKILMDNLRQNEKFLKIKSNGTPLFGEHFNWMKNYSNLLALIKF